MILLIIIILLVIVILYVLTLPKKKIKGIYSRPNQCFLLKYWAFMALFKLRKLRGGQRGNRGSAGLGVKSKDNVEDMEKVQPLPLEHSKAVDAVYFNGGDGNGWFLVAASARRHKKLTQTLCILRIPDLGLAELPSMPDTTLYRTSELEYAASGLELTMKEPMKKWTLIFKGKMRLKKLDGTVDDIDVDFDLEWISTTKYFDFDTDLDPNALSSSIAREQWSRHFFQNLKKAHQTHYEQFGEMTGVVNIAGYGSYDIKLNGARDHSYGNVRDWSDFHRYALQYVYLEDGTAICVGNICIPTTTSRLIIGYVFHPDGRLDTVSSTDLQLYKTGEDGCDPCNFAFNYTAGDTLYSLEGHVKDRSTFYMGPDWEARIVERLCKFTVNGVNGWGISEFNYRNHKGRPSISDLDERRE